MREENATRRKHTEAAIEYYRQLETFYSNRANLYRDSGHFRQRLGAFVQAWEQGVYRQSAVTTRLRGRALVKDIALLVVSVLK